MANQGIGLAGSGGGSSTTIYNGNSSLTGDRTVELNQKFLKFFDTNNNVTYINIDPAASEIRIGGSPENTLYFAGGASYLGDGDATMNSTFLKVVDSLQLVTISSGGSTYFSVDAVNNKFKFLLAAVPSYANQAAATGAGLVAGDIYRISSGGTSTLAIVE